MSEVTSSKNNILTKWVFDSKPNLIVKSIAECLGTMIFHFIGSSNPTPLANALCLMGVVYYTSKLSGGHINPAVTLTFTLLGHVNPVELLIYWFAQIVGGCFGALWLAALVPNLHVRETITSSNSYYSGCFFSKELSRAEVFGWESFCTFTFLVPIFSVVWYCQNKHGYGNVGPIMIGFSLFASALAAANFTGAALNPARVLASPMIFNCNNNDVIFYYIIGELVGAICAAIAIFPFYGISDKSWYFEFLPSAATRILKIYQPSIQLKTIDTFKRNEDNV